MNFAGITRGAAAALLLASGAAHAQVDLTGMWGQLMHSDAPDRGAGPDYGDYTGQNKWQVKERVGDEIFEDLRRSWDYPVPNGETLKDVYVRALPFYKEVVLPKLIDGENILITAHGNSIRALMHYIESIPEEKMGEVEMLFGTIVEYDLDAEGKMLHKKEYKIDSEKPNA